MNYSRNSAVDNNVISDAIKAEIFRFESVHPSIYAIYDIIEQIDDKLLYEQFRDHVMRIEDSFVNSQEWTLSKFVPDIRLGILGSIHSGKSALVHRYLTGSYMQDESPEGGRFKKEVIVDGQSHLLMIRDEGGFPDQQFSQWVDGVIFVFSLENVESLDIVYDYYLKFCQYRSSDVPLILVGTQDAISESNPRLIDESQARQLAHELRRCPYYETCATYGLHVERVFQDACSTIAKYVHSSFHHGNTGSRPVTPQVSGQSMAPSPSMRGHYSAVSNTLPINSHPTNSPHQVPPPLPHRDNTTNTGSMFTSAMKDKPKVASRDRVPVERRARRATDVASVSPHDSELLEEHEKHSPKKHHSFSQGASTPPQFLRSNSLSNNTNNNLQLRSKFSNNSPDSSAIAERNPNESSKGDLPTPNSTPTQSRKNWRKSNIFRLSFDDFTQFLKKADDDKEKEKKNGIGSGRAIPLKQGYLYKRSTKTLNKEWKKKYVTLQDNCRLIYHPSMHNYMDNNHGKEIDLMRTTVKIPGVAYRQGAGGNNSANRSNITSNGLLKSQLNEQQNSNVVVANDSMTANYLSDFGVQPGGGDMSGRTSGKEFANNASNSASQKKKHRRARSSTKTSSNDGYDSDSNEFVIVSIDNSQWHFDAATAEERDQWVEQIEKAIHTSLQLNESSKKGNSLKNGAATVDKTVIDTIKKIAGNDFCADCGQPDPTWASLNLGACVCIDCSGVHRNLGTHISRVRSLELDDWPEEYVEVMKSIGNTMANSVWEAAVAVNAANKRKPTPNSSREEKEDWIRCKYELRQFLPPVPFPNAPIQQQLIDAMARQDTRQVILCLALAGPAVNAPYSQQDPRAALHIAATVGSCVYIQLLLWYNADPNVVDHENRNAYFYAQASGKIEAANLLKQNGCQEQHMVFALGSLVSNDGASAISHHHQSSTSSTGAMMGGSTAMMPQSVSANTTLPRRRSNLVPSRQPQVVNELGI